MCGLGLRGVCIISSMVDERTQVKTRPYRLRLIHFYLHLTKVEAPITNTFST